MTMLLWVPWKWSLGSHVSSATAWSRSHTTCFHSLINHRTCLSSPFAFCKGEEETALLTHQIVLKTADITSTTGITVSSTTPFSLCSLAQGQLQMLGSSHYFLLLFWINFSSIFKIPVWPVLFSKTPVMQVHFRAIFLSLLKQCLKATAVFLVSHEHSSESARPHLPQAACKQRALSSSYSKGQAGIIFCSSHSDGAEQGSHMQKQRHHRSCPERNQRVSKHHCPSKKLRMTSRSDPGNYAVWGL